jgi:hypothetical protein
VNENALDGEPLRAVTGGRIAVVKNDDVQLR